jgi:hypothetical protein
MLLTFGPGLHDDRLVTTQGDLNPTRGVVSASRAVQILEADCDALYTSVVASEYRSEPAFDGGLKARSEGSVTVHEKRRHVGATGPQRFSFRAIESAQSWVAWVASGVPRSDTAAAQLLALRAFAGVGP